MTDESVDQGPPAGQPFEVVDREPTKVCASCRSDIPAVARRCKHCGARQRFGSGSRALVAVGVVALIVVVGLAGSALLLSGRSGNSASTSEATTSAALDKAYAACLALGAFEGAVQAGSVSPKAIDLLVPGETYSVEAASLAPKYASLRDAYKGLPGELRSGTRGDAMVSRVSRLHDLCRPIAEEGRSKVTK